MDGDKEIRMRLIDDRSADLQWYEIVVSAGIDNISAGGESKSVVLARLGTASSRQPSNLISYVAQEVMLRDRSGSAHLLACALRVRNIISTNVKLRSPSRRRITIADNRPATASMSRRLRVKTIDLSIVASCLALFGVYRMVTSG
jgi:hypothetical protein